MIHWTGLKQNALAWWSIKDNKALLYAYWERGLNLYNYLDKSHMVFAEQLMLDSNSTVDFTVKVSLCLPIGKVAKREQCEQPFLDTAAARCL